MHTNNREDTVVWIPSDPPHAKGYGHLHRTGLAPIRGSAFGVYPRVGGPPGRSVGIKQPWAVLPQNATLGRNIRSSALLHRPPSGPQRSN